MNKFEILLTQSTELTNDQIIDIFSDIGASGDIIIIKNDGLRSTNNYTVVISSSHNKFESIRYDSGSLSDAVKKALKGYVATKSLNG